ncbi:DUF2713 family protein, partial [Escherichia coli]
YRFSWNNESKLIVTREVFHASLAGARSGYACAGGWRAQETTENVDAALVLLAFNENLTKMMDAKLDAFLQKIINGLWPASEKKVLIHNMGGLRIRFAQQIRDLTDEQLSDADLYLDRIIFNFTIECLSTIDDAALNYNLQPEIDNDVFTVQLLCKENDCKPLAELPLQTINSNFNTLVHCYNQSNIQQLSQAAPIMQQKISQLLCALLISMSLTSVRADMMGSAVTLQESNLVETLTTNLNDHCQNYFNQYLQKLYKYNLFKCAGEKENSWYTINNWVESMIIEQEAGHNVRPVIPKKVMDAICTFLDIKVTG